MSNNERDRDMERLPSRYTPDDQRARSRRLWLRGGEYCHDDDDGVDPYGDAGGGLPPLPESIREEVKNSRRPDSGRRKRKQQL